MDPKQHEKIAVNVSTVTIIINLVLDILYAVVDHRVKYD